MYEGGPDTGDEISREPYTLPTAADTDLYVKVTSENTIHVGQSPDGGYIASWQSDNGLRDINYLLVQKYNDAGTTNADWDFCYGGNLLFLFFFFFLKDAQRSIK